MPPGREQLLQLRAYGVLTSPHPLSFTRSDTPPVFFFLLLSSSTSPSCRASCVVVSVSEPLSFVEGDLGECSCLRVFVCRSNWSGKVLNAIAPGIHELVGGSADLAPSNKTEIKCSGDYQHVRAPPCRVSCLHRGCDDWDGLTDCVLMCRCCVVMCVRVTRPRGVL